MDQQAQKPQIASTLLAIVLWLITFGLGLNTIYVLKEIYYLIYISLGGSVERAETFIPVLLFILALAFLVFIIVSTEYHLKKVGRPESWRLFGRTIAVELSLLILYYLLLL